jgi:hypothetical protein
MEAEITFDTIVPDAGTHNIEGCYRLDGCDWQIFYAAHQYEGTARVFPATWRSGMTGIQIHHPRDEVLNKAAVKKALTSILDVSEWVEVRGPGSLQMK